MKEKRAQDRWTQGGGYAITARNVGKKLAGSPRLVIDMVNKNFAAKADVTTVGSKPLNT